LTKCTYVRILGIGELHISALTDKADHAKAISTKAC